MSLEQLKMCLDTVTNMNEILNTVPGDIDVGYQKKFHNGFSEYDNESLFITIVGTLSEESAIPTIADEDVVDHILKNHHVVAVMFVLMMLLLVLKIVQSGVHHTFGRGHA